VDLIVIDVQMPDMGGLECLQKIKSHPVFRKIPVVMMAVSRNPVDIEDAFRFGAHHYIVKPYSQSNYVATLYRLFLVDWRSYPELPSRDNFVINLTFT
jgi:CheY-like chemotaxis protein